MRKYDPLSMLALSKAQQAAGQIPPDIANRVTSIESLINSGFTGTVTLVTSVNFTAQTVISKTLTFDKGILTGVV